MNKGFLFFVFSLCGCLIFLQSCIYVVNIIYPFKYEQEISKYASDNNLDQSLVASIIYAESRYKKQVISNKGAVGLMQLMPATAASFYDGQSFSTKLLFDENVNIELGCRFLKYLFKKYNDIVTVLACYNAGESAVIAWKGESKVLMFEDIRYKETQNYVRKILKVKDYYNLRLKFKHSRFV